MKIKIFSILIIALMVSSCETGPILPKYQTSIAKQNKKPAVGKGTIVFSTTVTGENSLGKGDLYLRDLDSGFKRLIAMWGDSYDSYGEAVEQNEKLNILELDPVTVRGKVHVLELDSGEYEFYHYYAVLDNYELSSNARFYMKFFVIPGDILYLGNLNFFVPDTIYNLGIFDRRKRDMEKVFHAFDSLKTTPVHYELLKFKQ